jgi:hypothetical protein
VCDWILHPIRTAEHQVSFLKCGTQCTNLLFLSIYVFSFVMTVTLIIMMYNRNMCGFGVMPFIVLKTVNIPNIYAAFTENSSYIFRNERGRWKGFKL